MKEELGVFPSKVIEAFNLDIPAGTLVYIGETNRKHMEKSHYKDYVKYFHRISRILDEPDFAGINAKDGSIELIKTFNKHVKLAIRIANDGEYYARSLYEVGESRVKNSLKKGQLKVLTNS